MKRARPSSSSRADGSIEARSSSRSASRELALGLLGRVAPARRRPRPARRPRRSPARTGPAGTAARATGRPRRTPSPARPRPGGTSCAGGGRSRSACRSLRPAPDPEHGRPPPGMRSRPGARRRPARRRPPGRPRPRTAPIELAHESSAPVLAACIAITSSTRTPSLPSRLMSSDWPAIIRAVASTRSAVARIASGVSRRSSTCAGERSRSASPARIARASPNTVHTVGRWRRSWSPIHDVVVEQREVVDQLDGDGAVDCRLGRRAHGARRERAPAPGGPPLPPAARRPRPSRGGSTATARSVRLEPSDGVAGAPARRASRGAVERLGERSPSRGHPRAPPTSGAAQRPRARPPSPLRTAPSIVAGQPVSVHAPAR